MLIMGCEVPQGQAPRLPVSTTHFADLTRKSTGGTVSTSVDSASPRPSLWRQQTIQPSVFLHLKLNVAGVVHRSTHYPVIYIL